MEKLLLAVVAAIAHPLTPLVVGPYGTDDDHQDDDDNQKHHREDRTWLWETTATKEAAVFMILSYITLCCKYLIERVPS